MFSSENGRAGLLLLLVMAVVAGLAIGYFASRDSLPDLSEIKPVLETPAETVVPLTSPSPGSTGKTETSAVVLTAVSTNWNDQLAAILESEAEDSQKADQFLALLPSLPVEGQVAVIEHVVHLVPDDAYQKLQPLIVSHHTAPALYNLLMADLNNRSNGLKLPTMLTLAKSQGHVLQSDSLELLKAYTEKDHGNNWAEWEVSVSNWLTENGN